MPASKSAVWAPAVRLLPILLLAFALRVYHLDFQSLWVDEGISLLRAGLPFGEMMRSLPAEHVPGFWLLLRAWLALTGTTDFALRYLSVLPSVLAIAVAYRLAADLRSPRAGLVAAVLLATGAFQIWYAQEARMYSWLVATGLGATWLLWRLLNARKPAILFVGYVLLVSVAINLHFYGFLIPLAHAVFALAWLAYTRKLRAFLRWVAAGCVVVVLYLPWWPRLLGASGFHGCCPAPDPALLPWRFLTAYTVGDSMPPLLYGWLPWLYLVLICFGIWAWWRWNRLGAGLLVCATVVPVAAALAIAVVTRDYYHERYTSFVSAPLAMLAGGAFIALEPRFWRLRRAQPVSATRAAVGRWLAGLLLAGLVGANGLALYRIYADNTVQKADFRSIVRRIEQAELPGDVILAHGLDPREILLHYYQGDLPVHNVHPLVNRSDGEVDSALAKITEGARRVWMVHYDPPTTSIEYWLASHGWLADRTRYGNENLTLSVYGLPSLRQVEQPADVAFGPQLRLTGITVAGGIGDGLTFRAGDLLGITTAWQVLAPPPSLNFSLRLLDSEGRPWLTTDYVPQEGSAPTQTWQPGQGVSDRRGFVLPADLPPDRYQVFLMLYDPATGVPVSPDGSDGASLGFINVLPAAVPPDPDSLPIPKRVAKRLGDELELLGFDITPQPMHPGQPGTLSLWWRAVARPSQRYQIEVQAVDGHGQPLVRELVPLSRSPTDTWQPGQVVREQYGLTLDPAAISGSYRINLSLAAPDGGSLGAPFALGSVAVAARPRTYRLPRAMEPIEVQLGDSIRLRGYDLTLPDTPGGEMTLTLYWQPTRRVPDSYKVFVHLVDSAGDIAAQADTVPGDGLAPTEGWTAGEVVVDRHTLTAPGGGHYRLLVGLYDPVTGERLPVQDQAQRPIRDNAIPVTDVDLP